MSKRLQVLLDSKEYKLFAQMAQTNGMSLGEWVRQALRKVASERSGRDPAEKLRIIHKMAAEGNAPTGDIAQMIAEIEKGYLK